MLKDKDGNERLGAVSGGELTGLLTRMADSIDLIVTDKEEGARVKYVMGEQMSAFRNQVGVGHRSGGRRDYDLGELQSQSNFLIGLMNLTCVAGHPVDMRITKTRGVEGLDMEGICSVPDCRQIVRSEWRR